MNCFSTILAVAILSLSSNYLYSAEKKALVVKEIYECNYDCDNPTIRMNLGGKNERIFSFDSLSDGGSCPWLELTNGEYWAFISISKKSLQSMQTDSQSGGLACPTWLQFALSEDREIDDKSLQCKFSIAANGLPHRNYLSECVVILVWSKNQECRLYWAYPDTEEIKFTFRKQDDLSEWISR